MKGYGKQICLSSGTDINEREIAAPSGDQSPRFWINHDHRSMNCRDRNRIVESQIDQVWLGRQLTVFSPCLFSLSFRFSIADANDFLHRIGRSVVLATVRSESTNKTSTVVAKDTRVFRSPLLSMEHPFARDCDTLTSHQRPSAPP